MTKPVLYLTLGPPGSGKTLFAQRLAVDRDLFHLNSDRLRLEMFDHPTYEPPEHQILFRTMDYIADELLKAGVSVIYDANINKQVYRKEKYKIAQSNRADAVLLWFQVPPDIALGRVTNRGSEGDKYFRNITPEIFHQLRGEIEEPVDEPFTKIDGTAPFNEQLDQLGRR